MGEERAAIAVGIPVGRARVSASSAMIAARVGLPALAREFAATASMHAIRALRNRSVTCDFDKALVLIGDLLGSAAPATPTRHSNRVGACHVELDSRIVTRALSIDLEGLLDQLFHPLGTGLQRGLTGSECEIQRVIRMPGHARYRVARRTEATVRSDLGFGDRGLQYSKRVANILVSIAHDHAARRLSRCFRGPAADQLVRAPDVLDVSIDERGE